MSKPYTERDLSEEFDVDLVWRRKELSDFKSAIKNSDELSRHALLRGLVTMIYAHWEGYVRECAKRYFEFFTLRRRPFSDFARQFYINSFLARISALQQGRASVELRCKLVNDILDGSASRFSHIHPDLIDTRSNLSTDVIKDICLICDVDGTHFETKRVLIDTLILKRRNAIAHGRVEPIASDEVDDLVAEALALMAHFRTLLENNVYTKEYEAA